MPNPLKKELVLNHRLFIFSYVNLFTHAASRVDKSCFPIEVDKLESFLNEDFPNRLPKFSNVIIGQNFVEQALEVIFKNCSQERVMMGSCEMGLSVKPGTSRLAEYLLYTEENLLKGLKKVSEFYNLINPHHQLILKPNTPEGLFEMTLKSHSENERFNSFSLCFEMCWLGSLINYYFEPGLFNPDNCNEKSKGPQHATYKFELNKVKLISQRHDPNLQKIIIRQAKDTCLQLLGFDLSCIEESTTKKVLNLLLRNKTFHSIGLKEAATELGTSERSLQRNLAQEGVQFSEVVQFMKEEIAKQMLQTPIFQTTEISHFLGFSESSAFSRSYKKWTGHTPMAYRKSYLL